MDEANLTVTLRIGLMVILVILNIGYLDFKEIHVESNPKQQKSKASLLQQQQPNKSLTT